MKNSWKTNEKKTITRGKKKMINLENTCVLVRTKEENEKLLKEAEEQGFHWIGRSSCRPLKVQHFPDILKFYDNNDVCYGSCLSLNFTFYEASELLNTKEMTAREFVEWYSKLDSLCNKLKCQECVLYMGNTKCRSSLCNISDWKENIDKILEYSITTSVVLQDFWRFGRKIKTGAERQRLF